MSRRISQGEYNAAFSDAIANTKDGGSPGAEEEKEADKKTKKAKALEYALEIRSFEIELYWKRATFYKIVLMRPESGNIIEGMNRFIAGPGPYSVSKLIR
jgi:hypothetical protein